jgi:isopentenyldiphosphate isomerase
MITILAPVRKLRNAAKKSDFILSRSAFDVVCRVFKQCEADPALAKQIEELTPEFHKSEFLRCVDHEGQPVKISDSILDDFQRIAGQHPGIQSWFQMVTGVDQAEKTLLIARWLSHLIGFRHTSVQLFIDHPLYPDHTLVQIRSTTKAEAPGCFDMPVAGHIEGLMPVMETLYKECSEEIGIDLDQCCEVQPAFDYDYCEASGRSVFQNVEYRAVFRCKLDPKSWLEIKPDPEEVAAMAVFSYAELEKMIQAYPERFATGLKASLQHLLMRTTPHPHTK